MLKIGNYFRDAFFIQVPEKAPGSLEFARVIQKAIQVGNMVVIRFKLNLQKTGIYGI